MLIVKVENDTARRYTITELLRDNPEVSFPSGIEDHAELMAGFSVYPAAETEQTHNPLTHAVIEGFELVDGSWLQVWIETALPADDVAEAVQRDFTRKMAALLNDFARTRNYDSIISAATYATSTNAQFATEGQRAVELRDEIWATGYQIIGDVLAGNRPMPTRFEDILPELPELTW
jgi:hypothetical protein